MLRFLADENFDNRILNGLQRRQPDIDVIRVQDLEIAGADDPTVLEWAARHQRILLTHDISTMTRYTIERVQAGRAMPGVIEVQTRVPIGEAVEDLLLVAEASLPGELEGRVFYIPVR